MIMQRIRMVSLLLLLPLATSFVHGNYLQTATPATSSKNTLLRRDSALTQSTPITDDFHPSLVSRLFFRYVNPIVQKAKTQQLDVTDALPIESRRNAKLGEREIGLSRLYQRVKQRHYKESPSRQLARALFVDNRRLIFASGMLRLANTLVQAFPAMIISRLLKLMEAGTQEPMQKSFNLVLQLVTVLTVKMILENQYFHRAIQTSLSVRASLSDLIFSQSLELPSGGSEVINKQNSTLGAGGVLNLLQSDCGNIENAFMQIHTAWDAPLQIGIYTALLYRFMGPSILYGIGVLIAVIPINMVMLRISHRLAKAETDAREARTKLTAESIRNMKILKLLAWDTTDRIEQYRNTELRRHNTRGALRALNSAISNAVPAFVLVVTMSAYKGPIVASVIFTAISLFNQLRFPLFFLPMFLDAMANGWNSMNRVSSFLSTTGNAEYIVRNDSDTIRIQNGNFFWPSTTVPALKDVNLDVRSGEIVAVVGSVGTGKTAFIKSLIGELQPVPANVISTTTHSADHPVVEIGHTSYCSQEAWLPKGSLKEAIVFGRVFDEKRYINSLYTAGLDQDFNSGTLKDETDVGEGGSSLSGGQRARVALARALYSSDAKVILLDDCLAALDAKVGALVFSRLQAHARKIGATVVLATNNQDFSRRCDKIVMMGRDGDSSIVTDVGSYTDLQVRGHNLSGPPPPIKGQLTQHEAASSQKLSLVGGDTEISIREANSTETCLADCESQYIMEKCPDCISHPTQIKGDEDIERTPGRSTEEEKLRPLLKENLPVSTMKSITSADDNMTTGAVPLKTYRTYLRSVGSPLMIAGMVAAFFMTNGAQFFQQYTVAKWTEAGAGASGYMKALTGAAVSVSIFLWIRSFLITRVGVLASRFWHKRMLQSVFSAPMRFFDMTPSGQLLSRFGKELETVDRSVPDSIGSFLFCFLQIGTSVAALVGVITPAMLVPLFLVGFLYIGVMARFRPAARDMKRVETFSRSPIYTNFGEAIRGSEVIRSVPGAIQLWKAKHRDLTNTNLGVFGSVKALDRWLSMRLETLGNIVVLATSLSSILLSRSGQLKAGSAGWGLTQSLAITGLMAWTVRTLTDLESNMMSVMRVQELTDVDVSDNTVAIIPKESDESLYPQLSQSIAASTAPDKSESLIRSGWPWQGHVSFCNVSMRYSPQSPLVLNEVSIDIPKGTTLGVVGRTGSGKSSLLLTLFRLVEIEGDGFIQIDGVDIRSVELNVLRRSLAIIPQDPILFTGSVAYNLDASGRASAQEMQAALEAASPELAEYFRTQDGLETHLDEGGKNLSAGQRQLICLARALVRRSKVLVLDEATSSVDSKTDQKVQATIRKEFVEKGVTVITVAHRLDTVLGYDRIAVLGDGKLLEYGSPARLLQTANGELRNLVLADRKSKQESVPLSLAF